MVIGVRIILPFLEGTPMVIGVRITPFPGGDPDGHRGDDSPFPGRGPRWSSG